VARVNQKRLGRRTSKLLTLAHGRLSGCATCMPDCVNADIDDTLRPLRLNSHERARLFRVLRCPGCGDDIRPFQDVQAYEPNELREMRRQERWHREYRPILTKFDRFVAAYPSLGGLHDVGKRLASAIERARVVTLPAGSLWFRATREQEATDPNFVHKGGGRFHGPGQRALYVADDPIGATVELLREDMTKESTVWIKELTLTRAVRVIDLSITLLGTHSPLPLLLEGMRFSVRRLAEEGPASDEYHLTRYIADLVRKRSVDGLVHTSSRVHPFRDDVFSSNLLLTRAVPFSVERDEPHRWFSANPHILGLAGMRFDPPIPTAWWERRARDRS
jgi:hypothetical protein